MTQGATGHGPKSGGPSAPQNCPVALCTMKLSICDNTKPSIRFARPVITPHPLNWALSEIELTPSCRRLTGPPATALEKVAIRAIGIPVGVLTVIVQDGKSSGPMKTEAELPAARTIEYENEVCVRGKTVTGDLGTLSTQPFGQPTRMLPKIPPSKVIQGMSADVGKVSIADSTVAAVTGNESSTGGTMNSQAANMFWFAAISWPSNSLAFSRLWLHSVKELSQASLTLFTAFR